MIGLCGAHRTGKTTLAKVYAKSKGMDFVQTGASVVFKSLGFDPKVDYDFKIRMMIQNKILDVSERQYAVASGSFVADRTPMDMLAYTMADVQRENLDKDDQAMFVDYMERCVKVTNTHFGLLTLVQPGIALVEEEGKAPLNMPYIEHLNMILRGFLSGGLKLRPSCFVINRECTDLNERVTSLDKAVNASWKRVMKGAETSVAGH